MLGRAIVPLLRPRNFSPAVRFSLLNQTRYYARDRKSRPDNDYKLPASAARPAWQQIPHDHGTITNAISHEQRSSQTQDSDLQPEFETSANSPKNDAQSSEELQFSSREQDVDQPVESSTNSPQGRARPEFGTSSGEEKYSPAGSRPVEQPGEDLGSSVSGDEPTVRDEQTTGAQQPLPDLTQGIPSTLDAELREARSKR